MPMHGIFGGLCDVLNPQLEGGCDGSIADWYMSNMVPIYLGLLGCVWIVEKLFNKFRR
jgi:hypothetical protein